MVKKKKATKKKTVSKKLKIGDVSIGLGETAEINLHIARLYDYTEMTMPIKVIRGQKKGPTLLLCAATHGDEINGTEIIRRILSTPSIKNIKGTLIAVPIVNIFGFTSQSRYLPDRRDLNRFFPGTPNGSLASRLAHIFTTEIVSKATHMIDFHTAAIHRTNLPQIRACLRHKETKEIAHAFGTPVVIDSKLRDGSLRQVAYKKKIPCLLFEGGEALRFDEAVITNGVKGTMRIIRKLGMLPQKSTGKRSYKKPFIAKSSQWVRAPHSGMLRVKKPLGGLVKKGAILGTIANPYGTEKVNVLSDVNGIIIGKTQTPLVNRGDALFHIASFQKLNKSLESIEGFDERFDDLI